MKNIRDTLNLVWITSLNLDERALPRVSTKCLEACRKYPEAFAFLASCTLFDLVSSMRTRSKRWNRMLFLILNVPTLHLNARASEGELPDNTICFVGRPC